MAPLKLPKTDFLTVSFAKISEKGKHQKMNNGRNAISMPARPEEIVYVSASSDESLSYGSDDVFQSFSDEGNEAMFFRPGIH